MLGILLGTMLGAPRAAQAQTPPPPADSAARAVCFRGRPLPRCRTFALFELGYSAALAGTRRTFQSFDPAYSFAERDLHNYLALEVGGMRNRDRTRALGATLHVGVADAGARLGLKARRRTWLADEGTFDVAAGPLGTRLRGAQYNAPRAWAYGGTAGAALGWRDYGAVTLDADVVRAAGRTRAAVYGGARLGSGPAVVGTGLLAAGFAFLYVMLSGAST